MVTLQMRSEVIQMPICGDCCITMNEIKKTDLSHVRFKAPPKQMRRNA